MTRSAQLSTYLDGFSPIAGILMEMLQLKPDDFDTWVDAALSTSTGDPICVVVGIPNKRLLTKLRKHPRFIASRKDGPYRRVEFSMKVLGDASDASAHAAIQRVDLAAHTKDVLFIQRAVRNYGHEDALAIWRGQKDPPPVEWP